MICFYLMGPKGYAVLHDVVEFFGPGCLEAVVAEKDSQLQKDYYREIENFCESHQIPFYNRKENFQPKSIHLIAVSWRWLMSHSQRLIVLHDSLLPRYRGFNPLVTALINGDEQIGVTAIYATHEYDAGDIIYQSSIPVQYPIKIEQAISNILSCYSEVVKKIIADIISGTPLPATPQSPPATYSLWRDEKDYLIDWRCSAAYIKRFVDSVGFPYKGACTRYDHKTIRIFDVELSEDFDISNRTPGKVFQIRNGIPYVVCGSGILTITHMVDENYTIHTFPRTRIRLE
jgi:methionyl-tRNA formyltransferase